MIEAGYENHALHMLKISKRASIASHYVSETWENEPEIASDDEN
jgi:hypothetical protein